MKLKTTPLTNGPACIQGLITSAERSRRSDFYNMSMEMDLHQYRLHSRQRVALQFTVCERAKCSGPDRVCGLTESINQFRLHETTTCQQITLSLHRPKWENMGVYVNVTICLFLKKGSTKYQD